MESCSKLYLRGIEMRSSMFAEISMCCWRMSLFRAEKPPQDGDDPGPQGGTRKERQAFLDKIVTLQ